MNELDKLFLLKLATGIYFTETREFLTTLHAEFGTEKCTLAELEAFLTSAVDFNKLPTRPVEQEVAIEVPSLDEIEEEQEAQRAAASASPRQQTPIETHSRPLSPSTTIPVKTPSGRTLRSTAAVAPSEPRRLRSSK